MTGRSSRPHGSRFAQGVAAKRGTKLLRVAALLLAAAVLTVGCGGEDCGDLERVCNRCSNALEKQICLGTLADARKQSEANAICKELIRAFPDCK